METEADAASLRRRGLLCIIAASLLWSTGGIGIKAIPDSSLVVAFYRSLFAAITLLLIFRPKFWRWSPAFLIAIASYAGCLTSFVVATKMTTAANAIFLQYSGVVWVLLFAPLILREALNIRDVIAIGIAIGGMARFFVQELETRGMAGNLMALLSSVLFATLIISLRVQRGEGAEAAVTYGNIMVALVIFPFIANEIAITRKSFSVLLLLGIFKIAIPYALFVYGLRHVTATQASLTGMLEPVANPLWVFLLLGEKPKTLALIGGAIVLAAIAWRTVSGGPAAETPLNAPD